MLKKLTVLLAVGIAAAMLHLGKDGPGGPPEHAASAPPAGADIEVSALPGEATAAGIETAPLDEPVPLVAPFAPDGTPRDETTVPTVDVPRPIALPYGAEPMVTVVQPDPAATPLPEAEMPETGIASAPEHEPEPDAPAEPSETYAVARSIPPYPRPVRLSAPEPTTEITAKAPPEPVIDLVSVEPVDVALAVEKALAPLEEDSTPVTLAVVEALADTPQADTPTLYVTGHRVNLRAAPDTDAGVVIRLDRGDAAELLSRRGDGWLRIRDIATGEEGFMSAVFLSDDRPG